MILTDLSNTIKKLWEKISFHKHFNATIFVKRYPVSSCIKILTSCKENVSNFGNSVCGITFPESYNERVNASSSYL